LATACIQVANLFYISSMILNTDPAKSSLKNFIHGVIPIKEEVAWSIVDQFIPIHLKRNELLLREGEISNKYLFLETGFLRSYLDDTEGNEITINFHGPNSMVFEVSSFFQRIPTFENIQVLKDSFGYYCTYEILNKLFHSIPEFRDLGRAVLVKGFISYKERTFSLINKTAEQRYESLLSNRPEVFQNAPLKYIASYLGITDTSLSRIRKEFTQK